MFGHLKNPCEVTLDIYFISFWLFNLLYVTCVMVNKSPHFGLIDRALSCAVHRTEILKIPNILFFGSRVFFRLFLLISNSKHVYFKEERNLASRESTPYLLKVYSPSSDRWNVDGTTERHSVLFSVHFLHVQRGLGA